MQFLEDHEYIRQTRQGDTQAFGLLVQKHQNLVFTLAFRMLKNREEAQEAAQDSFVRVYQCLSSFQGKSKFTTWLYRIVYNECLGRLRKSKQQFTLIEGLSHTEETTDFMDGLEIMQQEERAELVKMGIQLLNPSEAAVLTLFYLEDQSIKEICSITGSTESNVKVQLFRGRKNLASALQKLSNKELIGHS